MKHKLLLLVFFFFFISKSNILSSNDNFYTLGNNIFVGISYGNGVIKYINFPIIDEYYITDYAISSKYRTYNINFYSYFNNKNFIKLSLKKLDLDYRSAPQNYDYFYFEDNTVSVTSAGTQDYNKMRLDINGNGGSILIGASKPIQTIQNLLFIPYLGIGYELTKLTFSDEILYITQYNVDLFYKDSGHQGGYVEKYILKNMEKKFTTHSLLIETGVNFSLFHDIELGISGVYNLPVSGKLFSKYILYKDKHSGSIPSLPDKYETMENIIENNHNKNFPSYYYLQIALSFNVL